MISREDLIGDALAHLDALIAARRRAFCDQPVTREISVPQLHILMTVQDRGDTMISDLAARLGVSLPSTSSLLDRMEQRGLVMRVRDQGDRRIVRVTITERGADIVEEMIGLHREQARRLLESMTEEELDHVAKGLAAVQRAVIRVRLGGTGVSA